MDERKGLTSGSAPRLKEASGWVEVEGANASGDGEILRKSFLVISMNWFFFRGFSGFKDMVEVGLESARYSK